MNNFDAVFEFDDNSYKCTLLSRFFDESGNLPKQFKTIFKDVTAESKLMKLISDFYQNISVGSSLMTKEAKIIFNGNTWLIDDIKLRGAEIKNICHESSNPFDLEAGWKCENYKKEESCSKI